MRLTSSIAAASLAFALLTGTAVAQTAAPATAPAQTQFTASHLALAKEVAQASGITRSFSSVTNQILEQVRQINTTRPEIKKDLEEVLAQLRPELELQQQQIVNAATRVFATYLTEAELKDINTFFNTPSGKRYIETQPQILDAFMAEFQKWSNSLGEYVMVRVRAELGKRGHKF